MKCSFGISSFLEEIFCLSHSIIFLYFFALISEGSFLNSPLYSLELYIQMDISFLFSFAFHFSPFLLSPQTTVLRFSFLFLEYGLDHCLLCNVTNLCP